MSSEVKNTQANLFEQDFRFNTGVRTQIVSKNSPSVAPDGNGDVPTTTVSRAELVDVVYQDRLNQTKKNPTAFGGLIPKKGHILFSLQKAPGIRRSTIPTPNKGDFPVLIRLFNHLNKLNGKLFKNEEGVTCAVTDAPCSCWDRTAPDDAVPGARVVETESKDSIFYGGRPDLKKRAEILGEEIFKNEMASKKNKGIKLREDGTYELHYLVGSLTNTLPGLSEWRKYVHGAGQALDERDSLELEVRTLGELRNSTTPIRIEIEGETYNVLLKPMHTHCMVNCFSFYKFFKNGGQDLENKINTDGYAQLIKYYNAMDKTSLKREHKVWADEIVDKLRSEKESTAIAPHLRLAMVDMLAQICRLPVVLHCKSVVDRTSGAGAVSIANRMVLDDKMEIEPNMEFSQIIKQDQYKKNFVMALQAQLSTSADLRSAVNLNRSINTNRVLPGYEWHEGVDIVAFTFAEFIPKDGLKPITTMQKVKNFAIQLFVFTITLLAYFLGVGSLLKLPIVRPTWLKPTHTFDHKSDVLSEGGNRPLLVGPHHREMKRKIKEAEKRGKLDESTLNVLRQKAILQGEGFSRDEIERLKLLEPGVRVNYKLDLEKFYEHCERLGPGQLSNDLHRAAHTLNEVEYGIIENESEDSPRKQPIIDFVDTESRKAGPNDAQSQKSYLSHILSQTAHADLTLDIARRYQLSPRNNNKLSKPEFIINEKEKNVTAKVILQLLDTNSVSENPRFYNLALAIVYPFDHTLGADVQWTVLPSANASTEQIPAEQTSQAFSVKKPSLSLLFQNFSTIVRGFFNRLLPSSERLQ
ncbi:MAG: hypothetical protein FJZ61_00120 [Chlamydiae bacterium]|nr:hypothetical protein [Chlamydiota bacterium]